jgi:hypothetical protein
VIWAIWDVARFLDESMWKDGQFAVDQSKFSSALFFSEYMTDARLKELKSIMAFDAFKSFAAALWNAGNDYKTKMLEKVE